MHTRFLHILLGLTVLAGGLFAWLHDQEVELQRKDEALTAPPTASPELPKFQPSDVPAYDVALNAFHWPTTQEWLATHKIPNTAETTRQVNTLRAYLRGNDKDRKRIKGACVLRWGPDGENIKNPTQENLGCLAWRMESLAAIKNSERKEAARKKNKSTVAPLGFERSMRMPKGSSSRLARLEQRWNSYRYASYGFLVDTIDPEDVDEAKDLAQIALKSGNDCSLGNARAALILTLEEFLPEESIWGAMNQLYPTAQSCMAPDDDPYERLHLRMGLLSLQRGDLKQASQALLQSVKAEQPTDLNRSLFWLGYLVALQNRTDTGFKPHENSWWNKLIQMSPLSLHALIAQHAMGQNPLDIVTTRKEPNVSVYADNTWNEYNLLSFVFTLMQGVDEREAMRRLALFASDKLEPRSFETGLFLSLLQKKAGNEHAAIRMITNSLQKYGSQGLSRSVIELFYPIYFLKEIQKFGNNLEPTFVLSLMRKESSFNPRATSPRGAQGLMQVMPETARHLLKKKKTDLYLPAENIQAGTKFLASILKRYNGNLILTLSAYNAGPTPANRWQERFSQEIPLLFGDLVPYPETRFYVANILASMSWYSLLLEKELQTATHSAWTAAALIPNPKKFEKYKLEDIAVVAEQK